MNRRKSIKLKAYLRAVVAVSLMVVWTLAAASGFLLWLAPHGPRSGRIPLLLGLIKRQWGELHFWICVVAMLVTIVHEFIDWKALKACVSHLASVRRSQHIAEFSPERKDA